MPLLGQAKIPKNQNNLNLFKFYITAILKPMLPKVLRVEKTRSTSCVPYNDKKKKKSSHYIAQTQATSLPRAFYRVL